MCFACDFCILVQFSSVAQLCPTLCAPWSAACQASLSFTTSQILLKLMFIDSVMPSNHLNCVVHFFSCLNLSQHQGLFQWVSSSYQVAKVLELHHQHQHQSFQWIFRVGFLYDWPFWSPCCPSNSQECSTPQFKSIDSLALSLLLWFNSHIHTWLLDRNTKNLRKGHLFIICTNFLFPLSIWIRENLIKVSGIL